MKPSNSTYIKTSVQKVMLKIPNWKIIHTTK